MTSILLIPAPCVERGRVVAHIPYGLLSLQAVAKQLGRDVPILDLSPLRGRIFETSDEMAQAVAALAGQNRHDVVGLSTMCSSFHHSVGIAAELKRRHSEIRIWMGGPQASVYPELLLERFHEVDAVFVGEAEETFAEVLEREQEVDATPPTGIAGVCTRKSPFVPRPPIADLDTLPAIDLAPDYLPSCRASDDETSGGIPLEAQRGCPGRCSFCSTRLYWGSRVRYKSDMRIIEEMRKLYALTRNPLFCLLGDNFAASRQRLLTFAELAARETPGLEWECCMTIDRLREEDFEALRAGGCRKIFVGLESGSQKTLDRIEKGIDVSRSVRLVPLALEHGVDVHVSLIVGFPWETTEDLKHTSALHRALLDQGANSHLTTVCPLPGTLLEQSEAFEPLKGTSSAAFDELRHGAGATEIIGRCPQLFSQLGRFVAPNLDGALLDATIATAGMLAHYHLDRRSANGLGKRQPVD